MRILVLILIFSISRLVLVGQPSFDADRELVKQVIIDSFEDVLTNLELDKINDYYTEDFLLLENGEVWNNDSIRHYLSRALANDSKPIRTNKFEFIDVKIDGNSAWVAYQNYATFTLDDEVVTQIHWLESATAIKTVQGWRLEMLHSTVVKNE